MVFLLVFKVASVSRTGFTKHHDIGCFFGIFVILPY